MLLTEYDEKAEREYLRKEAIELGLEEGRAEGFKQGIEQGIEQGEDRALLLMKKLLESDRMEDLQRALRDRDYQKKLMKELNIL